MEVQALFGKRHRVAVVRPGEHAEQYAHVFDRPGHRTLDVRHQRVPAELGRVERHPPRRRADPDQTVEGGGDPDRAPEVGAEARRRQPRRDRRARAAARSPRGAVDVPRVAGWSPKTGFEVLTSWANSGVLVLPSTIAPAARSRSTQTESSSGTSCSRIFEPNVVRIPRVKMLSLTRIGTPLEEPRDRPAGEPPVGRVRLVEGRVVQGADRVQGRVDRLHPGERRLDDLAGAHRAPADLLREVGGRVLRQVLVQCFFPHGFTSRAAGPRRTAARILQGADGPGAPGRFIRRAGGAP